MKDTALHTKKPSNFVFEADGVMLNMMHGDIFTPNYYPRRKHSAHSDFHTHSLYEMFFVVDGVLTVHFDDEDVKVEKNTVLFLAPDVRHYTVIDPDDGASRYTFHFAYQAKRKTRTTNALSYLFSFPKYFKMSIDAFESMQLELYSRALAEREEALAGCYLLSFLLSKGISLGKGESSEQIMLAGDTEAGRLYKIESLCSSLYAEAFPLSLLAEELHLSERQIERIIKRHYGMGFHALITSYRMREAKGLLLKGASVSEVAEAVGYSSSSAFHRAFRLHFGMTPNEYMRENIK